MRPESSYLSAGSKRERRAEPLWVEIPPLIALFLPQIKSAGPRLVAAPQEALHNKRRTFHFHWSLSELAAGSHLAVMFLTPAADSVMFGASVASSLTPVIIFSLAPVFGSVLFLIVRSFSFERLLL